MHHESSPRKPFLILALAVLSISTASLASATTISGNTTTDNAFFVFLSTNNSVLGTQIGSGNTWWNSYSIGPIALKPGVTNYLQFEGINEGAVGALIGDFTLSDAGFHFANGTQSLSTDATHWSGIYNNSNSSETVQPWVAPTGGVVSFGVNGSVDGWWGTIPGISSGAHWIWPSDPNSLSDNQIPGGSACQYCTVDFSIAITPAAPAVPEPSSLLMLGSGVLGLAGVLRRKLKL